jgi:hypothetical protein
MVDDFDVDIARGQALHRPTRHVFLFRPSQPVDAVEVAGWRENREATQANAKSPLEIIREATEAIRLAMRHAGYH